MDYTDDIVRREHHIKRTLLAFACAVVIAASTWLAFTTYL
ncbi:hypothetical protein BH11MYX3_BH11MYX3_26290 [soil metagenome]